MSYKNSNLYASRVFAEHPLALWSIDENFYFTSLISENEKTINDTDWDVIYGSIDTSFVEPLENPIEGSGISKLYLSSSASLIMEISGNYISYEDRIDPERGSICLNFFVKFPSSAKITSIDSGFYINGQYYLKTKEFLPQDHDRWIKVESTQNIPSENNIKPVIRVNYDPTVVRSENSSYVYIAGLSVGQWSESFNSEDTGAIITTVPSAIKNLIGPQYSGVIQGVRLDPYGFNDEDSGYIVEYRKKLLAETSGIPMVYGSKNNVSILPRKSELTFSDYIDGGVASESFIDEIDGGTISSEFSEILDGGPSFVDIENPLIPSIIVPGKGFLNKSGKYRNLTVEFWARINNESTIPLKIFGPLTSQDGIYVGGDFITVQVGKYVKSYFIGQWYRPMLLHFGQTLNEIFLMINGEKVISIQIDSLDISTFTESNEDYLAFYGYEKILPFDVDSISIFPYAVTEQIAKLRFAYGQGVEDQEIISSTFGGDLTYVGFPYSGYSSTISFPDRTPWSSGYFNNLKVNSNGISLPDLTSPEIVFTQNNSQVSSGEAGIIWSGFNEDNYLIQNEEYPFISLKPNSQYNDISSTIYFSKINKTSYPTKSIYGVLKTSNDIDTEQSLLFLSNISTTDTFEAKIKSGSIQYMYNNTLLSSSVVSELDYIAVGIDLEKISEQSSSLKTFFNNPEVLSLNFAGSGSNTFTGKIFSLTLNNKFFTDKDNLIGSTGIADKDFPVEMYDYVGSYTLLPKATSSTVFFDIGATGYWETSLPMSYFGKYVTSSDGQKVYDLDLIQFNIDAPNTVYSKETEDSENYNSFSRAKTYITLQRFDNVGKIPFTNYTSTELIGNNRVLDFNIADNIDTTKFEVCDYTAIFPPKEIGDFNDYYLTTHIVLTSKGINTENLKIKNMSFSSASFDEASFYKIGTPTGRSIYPITKSKDQYVYKRKNPVIVEKEVETYFYITGQSGLQVMPLEDSGLTKGVSFPINETLKSNFRVVGFQAYLMFNEGDSFDQEKVFGKILTSTREYNLVLVPELGGKRANIKIVNARTNEELEGITAFLNGKVVSNILVRPLRWNSLIISFNTLVEEIGNDIVIKDSSFVLDEELGQIEIYSGVRVNNIAVFSDVNELRTNLVLSNEWQDIDDENWGYYVTSASTWFSVLNEKNIPLTLLSVDGSDIFDTYSGLSFAIGDDSAKIDVSFDSVVVVNDVTWTNFDIKPI